MIRPLCAAFALGLFASAAIAQPEPGPGNAPVRPTARAQASSRSGDEPLSNVGPVVERRTERGERAGEGKISDLDIAVIVGEFREFRPSPE